MRLRNVPGAREVMIENKYVFTEPEGMKGTWKDVFGNSNPVHIEIGMGKGKFLHELAKENPEINYIGIEKYSSVLVRALEKMEETPLDNIHFIRMDAENIVNVFEKGEVDQIYLNFSDPWPKSRHEKRRLTYKTFLDTYKQILPKNGEIHFKTDNRGLFEYSLASFSQYGMILNKVWLDLHASDYEGNVMTEYERKFSEKGQVIYRVEAQFKD